MKKVLLFISFVSILSAANSQDYIITQFGIGNDSNKLNTSAIQSIIDKAEADGGGTIVIPKGVFLTGALFFKPRTKIKLLEGAVLKGSDDISNYPLIPSRMEGRSIYYYAALINAYQVDSFSVTGPGTIDGNGLKFWKRFWFHRDSMRKIGKEATNLEVHRPRMLFIWGCNNVTIQNVKLKNAGFWTTHLYQCKDVLVENCDIRSPFSPVPAPSTDGIDLDVCERVLIRNCYISVNDDGIVIKGGKGPDAHKLPENGLSQDILIEHCTFGEVHAVLTFGSESIHAKNVTMRNCKVDTDRILLLFKMRPDTYQVFENVTVDNITGRCGSIVSLSPWKQFFNLGGSTEKPYGIVRGVTISNIQVKCKTVGELEGNPNDKVSGIVFKNITATAEIPILKNKYSGVKAENVLVNGSPLSIK